MSASTSGRYVTKPGRDTRWNRLLYGFGRQLVSNSLRIYTRGTVEGKENLPDGAFILAPIHRSYIDTPISSWVQMRRLRYLGKDSMWKYPWVGKLFTAMGAIPVHRGSIDREALRRCLDALATGQPVVLFPEGERKDGPEVFPLMDGAAFLASKAGVPIVPVGIAGSDRAMPRGAKFVYPHKVHVIVGEPISVETNDRGRANREQLNATTTELRTEIQRLYDLAQERIS
ncbi:lysophospholipid acyltransferase family protein [Ilumatobacter nonamiensis]|uniref:lysophospholipid acyltransferase family protein n=1 Tax=Ilumatobacter nonamiensis TaxID=467093 RepID=UPI00034C6DD0|nr:lysophospholipid acyltransferase family protein [Ilumatobacter nonamiensis]